MCYLTRRIKCDEEKPICKRCEKANRPCKYLPTQKKAPPQRITRKILPLTLASAGSGTRDEFSLRLFVPPLPSPRSEDEHRYFRVFESRTASELTGYFESDVWNRLILQACHRESYVWHAVVAIGALHKSLNMSQLWKNQCPTVEKPDDDGSMHHLFALQQYGKSLQLMKGIPGEGAESRFQNSLIASLLTVCFESYLGNQEIALTQIRTGVDILFKWPFKCKVQDDDLSTIKLMSKDYTFLDEDLVSTFILLDFQAMAFEDGHTGRFLSKKYPDIPPRFETIKEARVYLDVIVRRVQQWHSTVQTQRYPYIATLDADECSDLNTSREVALELDCYFQTMSEWYHAFKPIFNASQTKRGCREYLGATVLMARYIPSRFLFSPAEADETYSDIYLPECSTLVGLLEDVLDHDPNIRPGQATFVFGSHCVLALFVVSLRCRDPEVRRRAISLLVKHPRREGLWDSLMAATVASWVMFEEEKGMVGGFVPESARLRIVKNDFLLSERRAVIRCSRLAAEGSKKRILLPEVTLTW
ncbi:hypothetical protein BKA61DRAFT_248791 [Leptodontidium sp. MPI-SDFR-AT-0119]|nr:hypothetical protein BKA61DRAFT_248791 [Leptodontidium sp. MPI-SDFR-AT-0119]